MKLLFSALAASILLAQSPAALSSDSLPAFGASADSTSVSGLSSGAFMAVQYQIAYSATVKGAGIVAGGPYYCAANMLLTYAGICMGAVPFMPPNPGLMISSAKLFSMDGDIDPLSNLANDRIYVFSGTKDSVVHQPAVDATVAFFKGVGVHSSNLVYVNKVPAGHALLTPGFGNKCDVNEAPYISKCVVDKTNYDQPGAILTHIYGKLNAPATTLKGSLITFNQQEFADASTGMAPDAYAYVPASCTKGGCKVHVAFHGCLQSQKVVGDDFYGRSSYNNWADTNNIIMLFPQVNDMKPLNPQGCWDWYGYTGPNYAFKNAPQMTAVAAMIQRLTSPPTAVAAK